MRVDNLRNIAIIAHVDHGKTTMVDKLLRATDAFRANQQVEDRVLILTTGSASAALRFSPRTSLSSTRTLRSTSSTPRPRRLWRRGRARAAYGRRRPAGRSTLLRAPCPQTRFVLRHAIDTGLKITIVINKIDPPGASPGRPTTTAATSWPTWVPPTTSLGSAMEHVVYATL